MKVAAICSFNENRWPAPDEVRSFFLHYAPEDWSLAGGGGSLTLYGAESTEDREPFKDRIDVWLTMEDDPESGLTLMYSKTGGGYSERYYSLGDMQRADEVVTTREGHALSKALFIPRQLAWFAIEDFLMSEGRRSERIAWISNEELPEDFPA